jgi:hypothetical protein
MKAKLCKAGTHFENIYNMTILICKELSKMNDLSYMTQHKLKHLIITQFDLYDS